MFQWLIELLQELQQKSHLEQLGCVLGAASAGASTVAGLALGYRRLIRRKYAKMQEEYEQLSAKSESYQLRIKDLKAEIDERDRMIDALRARVPEFQLEIAESELGEGNEIKTVHILIDLYAAIRSSISSCCFQLGQYRLAMYVDDATAGHLYEADRLVRISSLLEPERKDVRELLAEIEAIRAGSAVRAGDHQTADAHWDMAFAYVGDGLGEQETLVEILNREAHARRCEGLFSTAAILRRRAAMLATVHLGPVHPTTLATRRSLGELYVETGRYEEAESLFKDVLAKQEQTFDPHYPDTLTTRHNLAWLYVYMGRYEEAEPLLKEVLAKRKQRLNPDDQTDVENTCRTAGNLAWLYEETGRYGKAEPLLKEALAKQEQKLSPDHPDTLVMRQRLAVLYTYMGRYNEAEPLLEDVFAKQEQKLSLDHPDTLVTRRSLGSLYVETGRYEEAEPLLKEALAKQERKLGRDHPATLVTRQRLAVLYTYMGRYDEAEPLLEDVFAKQEQKFSLDHPDTLVTRRSLGSLYVETGRYEEAEPLLKETLGKYEQKLGAGHPDTKKTQTLLNQLSVRSQERRSGTAAGA